MTGLGDHADEALQVEHVQARDGVLADVAAVAADLLVAAGAERLVLVAPSVVQPVRMMTPTSRVVARNAEGVVHR